MKSIPQSCFGDLDKVFPLGAEGLREVPQRCWDCPSRQDCLQAALNSPEGIRFREERLDSAQPPKGWRAWIRRWSEKKILARERSHKEFRA